MLVWDSGEHSWSCLQLLLVLVFFASLLFLLGFVSYRVLFLFRIYAAWCYFSVSENFGSLEFRRVQLVLLPAFIILTMFSYDWIILIHDSALSLFWSHLKFISSGEVASTGIQEVPHKGW